MRIETERLLLRPWTEEDAESLYEYARDPAVGPNAGWPVHTSVENSREIIRDVLSAEGTFAVCLKTDNRAIGCVGLIQPARTHTKAIETELEVGYWIGVPFWGNGYIPEAVRALQRYAFEELGCTAMWCGYYDGNEKSKRCQEKCGFRYHHTEENKPCELMGDIRTEHFSRITKSEYEARITKAMIYIHGKGGSAEEAQHYAALFPSYQVCGFDYSAETPWDAQKEFLDFYQRIQRDFDIVSIIANSIGAFFTMHSLSSESIQRAYFISPIVNMEKLIADMMQWANVTEAELEKARVIETQFGETLSWDYLTWVRNHPIHWEGPTSILYGSDDNLQSLETMEAFTKKHGAKLTIMKNGEHWFHTVEQMTFLDNWIRGEESNEA